jgi:Zn-dependent metalloprotease
VKFLKTGLSLVLLGSGLAAVPGVQAAAAPTAPAAGDSLVQRMRSEADGGLRLLNDRATGKVGFARATGAHADLFPDVSGDSPAKAVAKVDGYLDEFARAFGSTHAQLDQTSVTTNRYGTTVSYVQRFRGVEVFGSGIKAHVDRQGDLTSVNGFAVPELDVDTEPAVSAAEAGENAVAFVKGDPAKDSDGSGAADTTGIEAGETELVVYRTGFLKGEPGPTVLAYKVTVTNERNIRDVLILDADTGKLVNRYSLGADALERELYEKSRDTEPVWSEGDPFPGTLNPDQQNLVNSAGESYWMFANTFGRDSYDGAGAVMRTVNNDPTIKCPNANWNGITTNYCDGVTSDDVVSHEWGHAYTEYTSGLIYQYQSGALNESYSDVWGETLDMINAREDEGETFDVKRPDGECEPTAPPALQMTINSPAGAAGPCRAVAAAFGPAYDTTGVTTDVVASADAANPEGPVTTDGCTPYTNAAAVAGKYAYADRGGCTFQIKVDQAELAGATGIVVGDNVAGRVPTSMSGVADIPGVMVTLEDGTRIKQAGTVNATIAAEDISDRTDSTRWLIGEKSEAFGGAIRDMWTPTCYGDPGKVTDAEYDCDPLMTDAGGVHGNSGVPNHAYALTVDGGTYNGQTITGIGLDQAAAVWWRAQTEYLVPSSNFTAAAEGLEASCTDLVGQPINELTTQPDATPRAAEPITADDCAQLQKAILATEMRTPVAKCNFQPLLDKVTPSLCGPGFDAVTVWNEDFEDGLAAWTASQELSVIGGQPYGGLGMPWEATSDAPGDHPGGVAYGPAPDEGQCTGDGETDFSSRDSIASPVVEMPLGQNRSPRLSFEHYVATEATYDGGNVKASVNGGPFTVIPAAAYVFNKPGKLATLAQGNSNPLAGQDSFTGTDGGETYGSWGTSQVDLGAIGVLPGDTVQFRFDIGRDGCGGNDGWYVDNIRVSLCKAAATVAAVHQPEPSTYGRASTVKVSVDRGPGTAGTAPTGVVVLRNASGTNLGEATLNSDGDAVLPVRATLPAGVRTLRVDYRGDGTFAPTVQPVTVTVRKATSRTSVTPASRTVGLRQDFAVAVKVAVARAKAGGVVNILDGGVVIAKGTVRDGVARVMVRRNLARGGHRLVAKYLGNTNIQGSRDRFTVRVRG